MAAYHDAVLLVGRVMRDIRCDVEQMEFVNVNHFRNVVFNGEEQEETVNPVRH